MPGKEMESRGLNDGRDSSVATALIVAEVGLKGAVGDSVEVGGRGDDSKERPVLFPSAEKSESGVKSVRES